MLQIEPESSPSDVKFKSNFMGSFSAGIFVPPNTIDFGNIAANFSKLIQDNWAVLALMCILITLFLLLLIWARRADIKDRTMVGILIELVPKTKSKVKTFAL